MANVEYADNSGIKSGSENRDKVHHTVTACVRCRQRKTRCDPTLPRCGPCDRSNSHCEYYDSAKNRTIPRTYITKLQDSVRRLHEELQSLEHEEDYDQDHESMARGAGLVKFNEKDESRFLGPSSGIAVTRFVMDFAKQNSARKTIKDVVSQSVAREIKQKSAAESSKPTSKVYPLISSVAADNPPNRETMEHLLNIYMVKAQYMLPLLHEPSFRAQVDAFYAGSSDPTLNFQFRLVIAISMQKLDTKFAGLADSYYLAALPYLADAVAKRDLSTLQCFALIAQYSLLTPTRTAAYWVVGMAAKLCQELGLCEEATIEKPPSGAQPNFLEVDMRRRLFWIITSMEYGLSHSLGRPSAFGVTVDNINVKFFELCDDRFITPEGLLPGNHPIMKKCISIHFFKMRLLQAEIRRTLYLRKRDTPTNDQDPWFHNMLQRIDSWVRECPKNDEGSGLSEAWFIGRKNTMIVFMYRPSPQIPTPSFEAAQRCYDAAVFNVNLQKRQAEGGIVDVTWIFTQAIFMALNTILWSLSYPGIRAQHPVDEVKFHIQDALSAIEFCADRWPGVQSAHQLYENLIYGCLKAYDSDRAASSPVSDYTSTATGYEVSSSASQNAQSPASTTATSLFGQQSPPPVPVTLASSHHPIHSLKNAATDYVDYSKAPQQPQMQSHPSFTHSIDSFGSPSPQLPTSTPNVHYGLPRFEVPNTNPYLPRASQSSPQWSMPSIAEFSNPFSGASALQYGMQPWLANYGDQYSPFMNQYYPGAVNQMQSLSQQEQMELMRSLETTPIPDVSNFISDATTFYTAHLP